MGQRKYTKQLLAPVVAESHSLAEVLRRLGLKQSGGAQRLIKQRIREYGLSTEHFTGQGWNRGLTAETNQIVARTRRKLCLSEEHVFCERSPARSGELRKRLRRDHGWEERCQNCGIVEWLGRPLTMHLDHRNGIHDDNRMENLRFLCPNCHQQTPTWGNKAVVAESADAAGLNPAGPRAHEGSTPSDCM